MINKITEETLDHKVEPSTVKFKYILLPLFETTNFWGDPTIMLSCRGIYPRPHVLVEVLVAPINQPINQTKISPIY